MNIRELKNVKMSVKLIGGFVAMAFVILMGGFAGWYSVHKVSDRLKEVGEMRLPGTLGLDKMTEVQASLHGTERTMLVPEIFNNESEKTRQAQNIEKAWSRADKGWKIYNALPKTKEEEAIWNKLKPAWEVWKKDHQEVVELAKAGKRDDAISLSTGKARDSFYAAEKLLWDLVDLNVKLSGDSRKLAQREEKMAKSLTISGTVLGVIIALVLGLLFSRAITKPIDRVVSGISEGADQVSSASAQVSSASQQLAEGASKQASSLEETSSTMEEISSMTKQNAENALQAKTMMHEVGRIIENVNKNMKDMAEAIDEVTKSSEETGKIVKTIDEIAFQTNLLALNAAVEAARAGEAGAGFAVVADEVRNLAMRAAEAAKNTSGLIEKTIQLVRNGNALTKCTRDAFRENMDISARIGDLIDEIAAASQEQAHGIEQVNKAIAETDKVTQQNAANAEESASASEEMNAQAEQMKILVVDLQTLVNGRTNGALPGVMPPVAGNSATAKTDIQQPSTISSAATSCATVSQRRKIVRPDQVIPMGEGGFKDF